MTRPGKSPKGKVGFEPRPVALEADALPLRHPGGLILVTANVPVTCRPVDTGRLSVNWQGFLQSTSMRELKNMWSLIYTIVRDARYFLPTRLIWKLSHLVEQFYLKHRWSVFWQWYVCGIYSYDLFTPNDAIFRYFHRHLLRGNQCITTYLINRVKSELLMIAVSTHDMPYVYR